MRFKEPNCPTCGKPASGAADLVPGTARMEFDPETGEFEYTGYTDLHYDGQENEADVERKILVLYGFDEVAKEKPEIRLECLDCGEQWCTEEITEPEEATDEAA